MEKLYDEIPVSVDCHPTSALIGTGFIDGTLLISSYQISSGSKSKKRSRFKSINNLSMVDLHRCQHKRSVRRVQFTPASGDHILVITQNRALCHWDVETGKRLRCIRECHDSPPFSLHCISDAVAATGDEMGTVKLWDWRVGKGSACVMTFDQDIHVDIINDLTSSSDDKILLSASGDGTLSTFNVKKRALEMQSEEMHAELLSVAIAKNGEKVICGSGEGGFIEIFNWGEFGNIFERMQTSHQDSVDRLLAIDNFGSGLAVSASSDGSIRLLQFGQNADLGIVGRHSDGDGPATVEDISVTSDRQYLISCGEDQKVRLWNLEEAIHRLRFAKNGEDEILPSKKTKKKKDSVVDSSFFDDMKDNLESDKNGDTSENESDADDSD